MYFKGSKFPEDEGNRWTGGNLDLTRGRSRREIRPNGRSFATMAPPPRGYLLLDYTNGQCLIIFYRIEVKQIRITNPLIILSLLNRVNLFSTYQLIRDKKPSVAPTVALFTRYLFKLYFSFRIDAPAHKKFGTQHSNFEQRKSENWAICVPICVPRTLFARVWPWPPRAVFALHCRFL